MTAHTYVLIEADVVERVSKLHGRLFEGRSCTGQHLVRFCEGPSHHLKTLLPGLAGRNALFRFLLKEHCCDENSIVAGCDVLRAVIWQWHQRTKLVGRKARKAFERCGDCRDGFRLDIVRQRLCNRCFHRSDRSYSGANTERDRRCGYPRLIKGCSILFTIFTRRYVQGGDYGSACSDSARNIPKVLLRANRSCDDRPQPEEGEGRDGYEQPYKCELSDFPRAFHDSPEFYFRAIVARLAEAT